MRDAAIDERGLVVASYGVVAPLLPKPNHRTKLA